MTGRHIFEPFDILEAAQVQSFLQDQAVMRFATTADRFTQLTSPSEGMVTYVIEVGHHEWWDGTDWVPLGRTPSYELIPYTATGTFVKAQFSWASVARIRVVGGGGASGGAGGTGAVVADPPEEPQASDQIAMSGGGGGGGYAESMVLLADMAASEPVTIGQGGTGTTGDGTDGQTSSFGTTVQGGGGIGSLAGVGRLIPSWSSSGAHGATNNVGDITLVGAGGSQLINHWSMFTQACRGGWSQLSGSPAELIGTAGQTLVGRPGQLYGGGATGATTGRNTPAATAGGNGAAGIVIVELYV